MNPQLLCQGSQFPLFVFAVHFRGSFDVICLQFLWIRVLTVLEFFCFFFSRCAPQWNCLLRSANNNTFKSSSERGKQPLSLVRASLNTVVKMGVIHLQESPPQKRFFVGMQRTLHATRRTPYGALRSVLAMSAWSVKTPTCSVPAL